MFGCDVAREFLHINRLSNIIRSHQLAMEGHKVHYSGRESTAYVATVWSAPNYCYRCGNTASVLIVDPSKAKGSNPGSFTTFPSKSDTTKASKVLDTRRPDTMRFFV